jgi:L-rhamnose isomerase
MSLAIGRETILAMLDDGDLEQVAPNAEFAQTLIDKARKHLATADLLQDTDLEIASDALYTAARLSVTALLATQGLRPTTKGGHIAPIKAVRARGSRGGAPVVRPSSSHSEPHRLSVAWRRPQR